MNHVLVSLVIVTRNTVALLRRALDSITPSCANLPVEVIVVDNGSSDGTPEMVRSEYPWIKYVYLGTNEGFSRANNAGARFASGRYLCLMNSDARLKPDSLARCVAHLEAEAECGLVGVQLLNTNGTLQNSVALEPSLATELLNKSLLRRLAPSRYGRTPGTRGRALSVPSVIGAFMLVRRELWEELRGLDERFFFYFEETDFCRRVRDRGFRVDHLGFVEVWHDQGASANKVRNRARIEFWRSRYTYFLLHHGPQVRALLMTGLLVRLLLGLPVNVLLAAFVPKVRVKLIEQTALLGWHLGGCPLSAGLAGTFDKPPLRMSELGSPALRQRTP